MVLNPHLINSNTIAGGDLGLFVEVAGKLSLLPMYKFPTTKEMEKYKVQTIFLGPAWPDWSGEVNSRISISHGLKFHGGNMTALVGHSGGGKSTILNMIPRIYSPQKGKIEMEDGVAFQDIKGRK